MIESDEASTMISMTMITSCQRKRRTVPRNPRTPRSRDHARDESSAALDPKSLSTCCPLEASR
eukprot:5431272-Prymnesium_polylepis.1